MSKKGVSSFEKSMAELEAILETMTDSSLPLDDSIKLYAKAAELIEACNQRLAQAGVEIAEIDEKLRGTESPE